LPRLKKLFARWRPEDIFVSAAVGGGGGTLPFFEFESDVLSTLDKSLAQNYIRAGNRLRRELAVPVRSVDSILEKTNLRSRLSIVSIDIEGHELDALKSMNIRRWNPRLFCIEVQTADGATNRCAIEY
jgi:FkbM family methyltransferase